MIELLKTNGFDAIPKTMKPHKLIGNYKGCLECQQADAEREIYLLDIGSHSDLF